MIIFNEELQCYIAKPWYGRIYSTFKLIENCLNIHNNNVLKKYLNSTDPNFTYSKTESI